MNKRRFLGPLSLSIAALGWVVAPQVAKPEALPEATPDEGINRNGIRMPDLHASDNRYVMTLNQGAANDSLLISHASHSSHASHASHSSHASSAGESGSGDSNGGTVGGQTLLTAPIGYPGVFIAPPVGWSSIGSVTVNDDGNATLAHWASSNGEQLVVHAMPFRDSSARFVTTILTREVGGDHSTPLRQGSVKLCSTVPESFSTVATQNSAGSIVFYAVTMRNGYAVWMVYHGATSQTNVSQEALASMSSICAI